MTVDLSNALATSPTALHVGTTTAGPVFPITLGSTNCTVYTDAVLVVGMGTSANGTASVPLNVPNLTSLVGAKLYFQWGNLDQAANSFGVTTSNYGRVLFGS